MITLVARRALADYARRPLNVVLLVAVPMVIVVALGGELANTSKLLSTVAKPTHLEVATAGWAAAAVAGLGGFFQVVGSRLPDRRLAAASTRSAVQVAAGRLVAASGLAAAAAAAALVALAIRDGVADPARAIPAVMLVAVLYVAIGVLVGTAVRSEMNGALIVSVIWMLDVFVGSGVGGSTSLVTRFFPLHFPTMILTSQAARHGGPIGDAGWALMWTAGLAGIAALRLVSTTRPARRPHASGGVATGRPAALAVPATTVETANPDLAIPVQTAISSRTRSPAHRVPKSRTAAGLWAAVLDYRRNRVLWVLVVLVPVLFVALAAAQTPAKLMPVALLAGTRHVTAMLSLRQIHAGEMASIASALLAGVAGLFVVTGSADGDRRLVLAGFRPRQVLAGHLTVIAAAAVITTIASLTVSAVFFSPRLWPEYAAADLLIALTYAMVGVLLGSLVGRLGGLYLLLLLSIVDVGYGQTVMFHPNPPGWGAFLPAHGAGRLLLDGAFTTSFEQYGHLLLALAWLAVVSGAALITFRHQTGAQPIRHLAADPIHYSHHPVATGVRNQPHPNPSSATAFHRPTSPRPGGNQMTTSTHPQERTGTNAASLPATAKRRWRRPSINIAAPERAARICIGVVAVIVGAVLLVSAGSALAVVLEVFLIAAGVDLAVTGALGHCPLYAKLGHLPPSLRRSI